jgi:hypothetical protein
MTDREALRLAAIIRAIAQTEPGTDEAQSTARELVAALGAALDARLLARASGATPAPTLDPGTFYFTRDMVRGWRHSAGCEGQLDSGKCVCGLWALHGIVEPLRHKLFAIGARVAE